MPRRKAQGACTILITSFLLPSVSTLEKSSLADVAAAYNTTNYDGQSVPEYDLYGNARVGQVPLLQQLVRFVRAIQLLGSLLTGLLFWGGAFCRNFPKTRTKCGRPYITMFHEVATLVQLIESSKPEARAEGIRLIVLLEVP